MPMGQPAPGQPVIDPVEVMIRQLVRTQEEVAAAVTVAQQTNSATTQKLADVVLEMSTRPTFNSDAKGSNSGLKPKYPVFEGRQGIDSVEKFKTQVLFNCLATNTTNETQKVAIAASQLRGQAAEWWQVLCVTKGLTWAQNLTFNEFFELLDKQCKSDNHERNLSKQLKACRQTKDVHDYISRFSLLANQLSVTSDFDKKWIFIEGLKPSTRFQVEGYNPRDLNEAFRVATNYDSAYNSMHPTQRSNFVSSRYGRDHTRHMHRETKPVPMEVDMMEQSTQGSRFNKTGAKTRDLSRVKCYNCGEFGHYKSQCKKNHIRANNIAYGFPDDSDSTDDLLESGNELYHQ